MNDLIHKIVGTIIEVGQSDVGKFRLGETIRYTPSEILEILKQHKDEIFAGYEWIPVSERLPKCEQEVLICTKKKLVGRDVYIDSIITPAIYEDGTMLENDSSWHWEDIDWAGWDDEEDCGIIPEGWWENRHFNQDDVYNNPVDQEVVAWMPLPEPYKGDVV